MHHVSGLGMVCLDPTFTLTRGMAKFNPCKISPIIIPLTSFQGWVRSKNPNFKSRPIFYDTPSGVEHAFDSNLDTIRIENWSSTNYQRPLNVYTECLL